jgi:hypothetical protein
MRKLVTIGGAVAVLGVALSCNRPDQPVAPRHDHGGAPLASIINNNIDLDGMPDLIVRSDVLEHGWVIRDENLSATACSVIEGGVEPGVRRLLRMTVMTPNIGDADIFIGDPNTYVDQTTGESDLYEFATCHNHYHFKHYALYELVQKNSDGSEKVWRAAKRGFCMLDTDPNPAHMGEQPREHNFLSCGTRETPGNQGVSHGWADTYRFFLGGQYFILDDNGGKQDPVPPGLYYMRITVNPAYTVDGACPRATEGTTVTKGKKVVSVCHQFAESRYDNNTVEVAVTIPQHVGRSGYGPLKDAKENTNDPKYEASR